MDSPKYSLNDIRNAFKKKDAWWTVYLVDPVASRLMLPLANYTRITPNQLTVSAFVIGLMAAYCFYQGTYLMLIAGAVLYHISFTLDCMDGKISRLKGTGSIFGAWLDYILDRTRVAICAFSLMLGQYHQSGHIYYLYLAALICFLDSTRYMNSLLVYKSLNEMRKKMDKANSALANEKRRIQCPGLSGIRVLQKSKRIRQYVLAARKDISIKEDFLGEVISRFPSYLRIRTFFLKRRVRLHLISGIEYQMFIFIISTAAGVIKEGVIVSSILMILFESVVIYKLWLMTVEYKRRLARISAETKALSPLE